jgi:hypothetical protein
MAILDRVFGIEIECLPAVGTASREAAMPKVAAALNAAGIAATFINSHRGTARAGWTVKPDNSVTGSGLYGFEVVSPPITGHVGLVDGGEVDRVCAVLDGLGCWVNSTCGLHVHVDRPTPGALRRIAYDYATFESVIDSLMPATRRGDRSFYAASIKRGANLRAVAAARDANDICRILQIPRSPKYAKVNFSRYWSGTVEFRHHSGTTNATKIKNWVLFVLRFCERAAANEISFVAGAVTPERAAARRRRLGRRRRTFVALVTRPEGVTRAEIFLETGWQAGSLSMIRFARESGITLRRQRLMTGAYRYYGRFGTAEEVAAMPNREEELPGLVAAEEPIPSLELLLHRLDVPASERAYWIDRIAHHSLVAARGAASTEATL